VRGAARDADVSEYSAARLQELISLAKAARRVPEGPVGQVYAAYEAALRAANAFDADDLVRHVLELLDSDAALMAKYRRRFSHIVIDDFEDATWPSRELFARLAGPEGDVLAAADDDQAIASAVGAPDARAAFLASFPTARIARLARSYRSSGRITLVAARVAAKNAPAGVERAAPEVMKKRGRRVVSAVFADENEEAAYVVRWLHRVARRLGAPLARAAILYRHPVQARPFEEVLARLEVPYRVVGQPRFYERREVKDVVAYLKLTVGGGDPAALARIANVPRRGIGPASVATIAKLQHRQKCTMAEAALAAASLPRVTAQRAGALADLGRLLTDLTDGARRLSCAELIDYVVERSGYGRLLGELSRSEEETRREGIDELRGLARAIPGPAQTALATLFARVDREDQQPISGKGKGDEGVQLLTFAEAKGRDFDVVFMTGLEEGLLPGARAIRMGDVAIQADRRLFYVGITRARSRLVFTRALARTIFGRPHPGEPSRFLGEAGKRVRAFRLGHARVGAAAPRAASEPAAEPTLSSVREGQRVVHPTYGPGVVVRLESGARPMVTVAFDGGAEGTREKRLALAYARLQPA
jgi:DNA helicase-2/ATP-dependent DNA helicase PcrA